MPTNLIKVKDMTKNCKRFNYKKQCEEYLIFERQTHERLFENFFM